MTKKCSWFDENFDDGERLPPCDKPATHYSCCYGFKKEINVCQEHKCRCKQPVAEPDVHCVHYGLDAEKQKENCYSCQKAQVNKVSEEASYKEWAKTMLGHFESQRDEIERILDVAGVDRHAANDDGSLGPALTVPQRVQELARWYESVINREREHAMVKCICESPLLHRYDCTVHGDIADEIMRQREKKSEK